MVKILVLTLLASLPLAAQEFHGVFSGAGMAKQPSGVSRCSHIEMRFLNEAPEHFTIRGGGYQCGPLLAEYPYSRFERRGEKLFYEGREVWEINDKQLELWDEDGIFYLTIRYDADQLKYFEMWEEGGDFLTIMGNLRRQD